MINGLKPYPAMKNSGVPTLDTVPVHWELRKLRGILHRVTERNRADLPLLSVVRERGVVHRDTTGQDDNRNFIPDDLSNYKVVHPGQFAMNKMKAWQGSYGVSQYEGIVSPAYFVFDLTEVEGRFFHSAIRSRAYVPAFAQASDGVRIGQWDLAEPRMREIVFAIPPLSEQAAIVRFLDHADRRVRRHIRAKQKLMKLVEEQKRAIIHRAVTRGLDPNVRLKPSGVEWLGDVPEHWSVKRLKFLARITSGQVDPRLPQYRTKILVAPNHIKSGSGKISYQETAEEQGADSGKYEVRRGQIIYSKIRPNLRKAAIAGTDCLCSADMYPITVRDSDLRTAYMLELLLSMPFTKYAVDCSLRVAMPKVNREALGECWLWYPSLEEQDDILQFIKLATRPLDAAIERAQHEIDLLREYRTRLIANVVTGKLDVRAAAARLPQEAENLELLDETGVEVESEAEEADGADANDEPEEAEA